MKIYIGSDESGKGDYFGYIVVASVAADENKEKLLKALRVRDSKKLSDRQIFFLADKIKRLCKYDIVKISPVRYNELHKKLGNLNVVLAWAHARAIKNLLKSRHTYKSTDEVIIDKFCDNSHVEKYLGNTLIRKGGNIKLTEIIRAESYPAVAAASILARKDFLESLSYLSKKYKMELPKGATHVLLVAKAFTEKYGKEKLAEVAKINFKITKKI